MLLVSSGWRGEPESVGDDGAGGAQHRGDQRRQIEMALAGGAHDAGEHLLGVGAVAGAVATADCEHDRAAARPVLTPPQLGAGLATFRVPANGAGYADLVAWARTLGDLEAFGIEGTGSYGVGLARFVRRQGLHVVEVNRCDRRKRRNNGKSDTLDAEAAARSVLAGVATAMPKAADGAAEMVRQIKIARDTAVKARTTAMTTLKTLLVNAPSRVREALEPLTDQRLIDRCATLRPGDILDPTASVKHALRALATRWRTLSAEIDRHDQLLDILTRAAAPTLREAFGIGPESAAEMLIVAGDNPNTEEKIDNLARSVHAVPIVDRHRKRLHCQCSDATDLWRRRSQMFPHLTFGPDVEDHLGRVNPGLVPTIVNRLADLEETAAAWVADGGDAPSWKTLVTPESGELMKNPRLREARRFRSVNGERVLFEWHARFGGGRIHLRFDARVQEIEIGYVGGHLPLR